MKQLTRLLPLLALASALPAQPTQITLPSPAPPFWSTNSLPVAGVPARYQQWFSATQFQGTAGHPVHFTKLELIAGSPGGQAGALIDIEVTLANGPAFPSQAMNSNLTNPAVAWPLAPVVVVPRSTHLLGTATPGTFPLVLNFVNPFVWDGISPVVVEIKLYDNGRGNVAYAYSLQFTQLAGPLVWRMWGNGDPDSVTTAGFVQQGSGLSMRLTYEEGVTVSYGSGCPGAGNIVPLASTTGGRPLPGNAAWTQVVNQANSQKNCFLLIGASNQMFGTATLPLDMSFLGGFGCSLWTDIVVAIPTQTLGGGPGAGSASVSTPVPPVTGFAGMSIFTQWWILDAQAPNGVMAMSQALRHILG